MGLALFDSFCIRYPACLWCVLSTTNLDDAQGHNILIDTYKVFPDMRPRPDGLLLHVLLRYAWDLLCLVLWLLLPFLSHNTAHTGDAGYSDPFLNVFLHTLTTPLNNNQFSFFFNYPFLNTPGPPADSPIWRGFWSYATVDRTYLPLEVLTLSNTLLPLHISPRFPSIFVFSVSLPFFFYMGTALSIKTFQALWVSLPFPPSITICD